jgi:hypothetical protein
LKAKKKALWGHVRTKVPFIYSIILSFLHEDITYMDSSTKDTKKLHPLGKTNGNCGLDAHYYSLVDEPSTELVNIGFHLG